MTGPILTDGLNPPFEEPENPATTVGDIKNPETPNQSEVAEQSANPESQIQAGTGFPEIRQVSWYKDQRTEHPITDDIYIACTTPYIYVKVVFSEPMKHITGDDKNALPVLFIVADNTETRLEILPDKPGLEKFNPNTSKKIRNISETAYLCKYELPANVNSPSTIALQIGENTVDIVGNLIAGTLFYPAPFTVAETPQRVIISNSVLIPPAKTILSRNEKGLMDFFVLTGRDPTESNPQKGTNKLVDRISFLPLKEREEVYDALVAAVDLPSFAEAAEKMKLRNVTFASLFMEAVKTKNWEKFNNFLEDLDQEIGTHPGEIDEVILARIYFEENSEDRPRSKECSCYWMLLEYCRLQLEHPHLKTSMKKDREQILCLYRQSAQIGNVLGLANPWN